MKKDGIISLVSACVLLLFVLLALGSAADKGAADLLDHLLDVDRDYDEEEKYYKEKMNGLASTDNPESQNDNPEEVGFYEDEPEQTDIGTGNNIIEIFHIGNIEQVYNGGTPPTFTLNKSYHVTELWSYHWNDGRGAPAGTLALKTKDGQSFGPWQARLNKNVYWVADINQTIPPGEYTVIDSDPSTLSQNASTGGQGMAWMFGYPVE